MWSSPASPPAPLSFRRHVSLPCALLVTQMMDGQRRAWLKQPEVAAFPHLSLSSSDPSVPSGASVCPPSLCCLLSYPFPIIFISSFELNHNPHIFGVFLKLINPVSLKSQKEGMSERQPKVVGAGAGAEQPKIGKARAAESSIARVSVTFASLDRSTLREEDLLWLWLPCFGPSWLEGVVAKTFFWHSSHHSGQREVELDQKQAQAIPFRRLDLMSQKVPQVLKTTLSAQTHGSVGRGAFHTQTMCGFRKDIIKHRD